MGNVDLRNVTLCLIESAGTMRLLWWLRQSEFFKVVLHIHWTWFDAQIEARSQLGVCTITKVTTADFLEAIYLNVKPPESLELMKISIELF